MKKKKIKIRNGLVVAMLNRCKGGSMKNKKDKRKSEITIISSKLNNKKKKSNHDTQMDKLIEQLLILTKIIDQRNKNNVNG